MNELHARQVAADVMERITATIVAEIIEQSLRDGPLLRLAYTSTTRTRTGGTPYASSRYALYPDYVDGVVVGSRIVAEAIA